jgi:hypothetical protein
MKRLNKVQRDFIRWVVEYVSDVETLDDFSVEGVGALKYMCKDNDGENLDILVGKFIKQLKKEKAQFEKELETAE